MRSRKDYRRNVEQIVKAVVRPSPFRWILSFNTDLHLVWFQMRKKKSFLQEGLKDRGSSKLCVLKNQKSEVIPPAL